MKRFAWYIEDAIADARQDCIIKGLPANARMERRYIANNLRKRNGRTNRRTYEPIHEDNEPAFTAANRPEGAPTWLYAILTDEQYTAVRMLANGRNWRQIAEALGVSHQWANKMKPAIAARLEYHREALSC